MENAKRLSPPGRQLRVAVVGLGVGEQHARAYAALAECRITWLVDRDRDKAERLRRDLGQGRTADSFEAVLDAGDVDVVSIASFDDAHFAQAVSALARRKHLFVEKPLCRSLEELRAIKHAWETAGRPTLESNLALRAASLWRWLTDYVQSGELGEIYSIDAEYLYGRLHKITDGWRRDVDNYSVMQGGGVHLIDLMLGLTGEKPVAVSTVGNRICTRGSAFRYNDFAAATCTFSSGMVGRVTANFGCAHPHQHVLRLYGTRGTFIYDDAGARLHTSRDSAARPAPIDLAAKPRGKAVLISGFVSLIISEDDTAPLAQRHFDVISVCSAADEALAAGREVAVSYV